MRPTKKFGLHYEKQKSIQLSDDKESVGKISHMMKTLRKTPPTMLDGKKIISIEDYKHSTKLFPELGKEEPLFLPRSDVLVFYLEDESKFIIRPSGTEPKIKIYGMICNHPTKQVSQGLQECEELLDMRLKSFEEILFAYEP